MNIKRILAKWLGVQPVVVVKASRLSDEQVYEKIAQTGESSIYAVIDELIERAIEGTEESTGNANTSNYPGELSFYNGGAKHLKELRANIRHVRNLAERWARR